MRKIVFIIVLLNFVLLFGYSQYHTTYYDFDSKENLNRVIIDTLNNEKNSWIIGTPSKPWFSEAASSPNVIITDSINPYSVNDSSVFTIWHIPDFGLKNFGIGILEGEYKVDCDSLNDFGKIEFSPDNGSLWVNLLNDTLLEYGFGHDPQFAPILTGRNNWTYFILDMSYVGLYYELADTVLFRFTFISDSIPNNRDGLMFDNLSFTESLSGIYEYSKETFKSIIYPNPGNGLIKLAFTNDKRQSHTLKIFSTEGRNVFGAEGLVEEFFQIDVNNFSSGIYYYLIENTDERKMSSGKFIVE